MTLELWAAFALASALLLASPGPAVLLVVSYAIDHGRASAWATAAGVALGDFVAMTLSLLGAGVVLSTSATLFNVMKLLGAGYLVWLGVQKLRATPADVRPGTPAVAVGGRRMILNAFAVTALHPGGFVFFIAFVPQFIDPARPVLWQFAIMEMTFVSLAVINVVFWAFTADALRARFLGPAGLRAFNRASGLALMSMGLWMAFSKSRQ